MIQQDLRDLMLKRIKGLQCETDKLRRQSGASMDQRTRSRLRQLSHESRRKAEMLQARYDRAVCWITHRCIPSSTPRKVTKTSSST